MVKPLDERYLRNDESVEQALALASSDPVICPDIFEEGVSCLQHVRRLSNPDYEVTENELINLVAKYFAHTVLKIPLTSAAPFTSNPTMVSSIFHHVHAFFPWMRASLRGQPIAPERAQELGEQEGVIAMAVRDRGYSLGMLGDVAPTVEIVQDIVERIIESDSKDLYFGLDMGTGSGVLGLAQYIQAKRNRFSQIMNFGLEKQQNVAGVTQQVLGDLMIVAPLDTTDAGVYRAMIGDRMPPHFISNENIPMADNPLGENEPFIRNLAAFQAAGYELPSEMFPQMIAFGRHRAGGINRTVGLTNAVNYGDYVDNGAENVFSIGEIVVNGEPKLQHEVGKTLRESGKLANLEAWFPRWATPKI